MESTENAVAFFPLFNLSKPLCAGFVDIERSCHSAIQTFQWLSHTINTFTV